MNKGINLRLLLHIGILSYAISSCNPDRKDLQIHQEFNFNDQKKTIIQRDSVKPKPRPAPLPKPKPKPLDTLIMDLPDE